MRILYIDCDTLRPDHLGCYGYHRNTSPNIDGIAARGVRFNNYYVTDAPCLPSRSALMTGRFGIHTGVVNHGASNADPFREGETRGFNDGHDRLGYIRRLHQQGIFTAVVSSFAYRHSAWWFYAGFNEMHCNNIGGMESADRITPDALAWLDRKGRDDNWYLHVNYWDPHTPYRAPEDLGNRFADDPPPAWHSEEVRKKHWESYGPHGAREPQGITSEPTPLSEKYPQAPREIASQADYKRWIDGYDNGIRYMDDHIGEILAKVDELGIRDETAIIVSADHGENQGELGIYGDHQTADHITSRVPLIVSWPGVTPTNQTNDALLYNVDFGPTLAELSGSPSSTLWDGESFAKAVRGESFQGHGYLVVSQCAWSCQRAVRWDKWLLIRTYHPGMKPFPPLMLFDIENDPHEQSNLAEAHPELVNQGLAYLEDWHTKMMASSESAEDPLWRVMREGGPLHTRSDVDPYAQRLRETGREHLVPELTANNPMWTPPPKRVN